MNSEQNVNARMLMLFPVNVVKDYFEKTGHKGAVISQIANAATTDEVNTFLIQNLNRNKLHVYVYNLNPPFNRKQFNSKQRPFYYPIIEEVNNGNEYTFYIRPQIQYTATAVDLRNGTTSQINMVFPQPIAITVNDTHLIIRATIIEKKVEAYMNDRNIKLFDVTKDIDDDFTNDITQYFLGSYGLAKCNLNKGVKYLVDSNIVDFKSLRIMNSNSIDTIVMNEDLTFKDRYPVEYKKAMRAPLSKSTFKYLLDDFALCASFGSDPNLGEISISLYPSNVNQVNNVISQILSNN